MELSLPYVWSDLHRDHRPGAEVWVGVRTPGTEVAERAERIRTALAAAGAEEVAAERQPDGALTAVHDRALLEYLAGAWAGWEAAGLTDDPGQDRVVPYIFPGPELGREGPPLVPAAASARAGWFAYDTMSLIGPGTWEAARSAAEAAATAADLVLAGAPAAYAAVRPPGHHATRSRFGGSCYLNNTAVAAARLHAAGERVAVLDVDAHHGNGTQQIFYDEPEVLTGSAHVDPAAGWFPHFLGLADETGAGPGAGANRNLPLAPGAGDEAWLEAVAELAGWAREAEAAALVVALGVDAAGGDPESPLDVSGEGFASAGRLLGELGLPTVVVQEGGYDLEAIGPLVVSFLAGLEAGLG